ncbi:MAG: DMT family transporter [Lachnospiraceae bacterium]|nr:DMT family transporter [Lachnospiraceae bacterium]
MQMRSEKRKKEWNQHKADSMIALVAIIWGSSYLLMKIGLGSIPPFSIIALRFGIAFFFVVLLFFQKLKLTSKYTLLYGALLGFILFAVFAFLMHGLETTTASNAGFLTSTTVVLVPIFHSLVSRKLPEHPIIFGSILTMTGIGFLTLQQSFAFHNGDLLCLCGAAAYACHILLTDRLAQKEDGLILGIWQLGFAGMYGLFCSVAFEKPTLPANTEEWMAVLGLALICSAFGFVVQPIAQKYTTPEHTGLLFALEPVFSAIFAFLFLHETLSVKGYFGAVLVLSGVLTASVFSKREF